MSKIWKHELSLELLNMGGVDCLVNHLGIEIIEFGDDWIKAKMPVDQRTIQPYGLLHGGASAALAETLGSIAANFCIEDLSKEATVGIEINANHLKSAKSGFVYGLAKPLKLGRKLQVWNIDIKDEHNNLICVSRLTTMTIALKQK